MTEIEQIIKRIYDGESFQAPIKLGVIKMTGPDARSFLQRMSTADMTVLSASTSLTTCFINHYGRMIDRVLIITHSEQEFFLVSSFASCEKLFNWLEHYHFIEDFCLFKEHDAYLIVTTAPTPLPLLWRSLEQECPLLWYVNLAFPSLPMLSTELWETLRIASVMPWHNEITDRFMPQNIGLEMDISQNKGCFIGQEVIAKALTYQKHPKMLTSHKLERQAWQTAHVGLVTPRGEISSLSPCFIDNFVNALLIGSSA